MVVDDDPFVRDVALTALGAAEGVRVTACADGAAALAALDTITPDLLLLDLMMPGMDGRTLWNTIRARGPAPRVLFLTGHDDDATRREVMALGAQGLIAKPFDPRTFAATVLAYDHAARVRADKIAVLTQNFAAHLPRAGAAVADAWAKTAAVWRGTAAEALLAEAHRLAGVASMFGFAAVGQAADRVEDILRAAIKTGGWQTETERAGLEDAVKGLLVAIQESGVQ